MKPTLTCPLCKKPIDWTNNPFRPFCSERCKLIDLGNWADEKYRVPAENISQGSNEENDDENN